MAEVQARIGAMIDQRVARYASVRGTSRRFRSYETELRRMSAREGAACEQALLVNEAPMTPRPGLAFVTVVGTLVYLGLAVLGWGGFAAFFSHPARIALAIAVFVMTGAALFSG